MTSEEGTEVADLEELTQRRQRQLHKTVEVNGEAGSADRKSDGEEDA
jgi:hypothetical protein